MRILLLDIETSPNVAHVWGLWMQNVSLNQIMESSYTLCYAAKWYGEKKIYFDSVHKTSSKTMLKRVRKLLDEADVVVHYNGTKFDIPTLQKEFILHGLTPPSPYKQIDLLRVARSQFRFPSNKLQYVASVLGLGSKVEHMGHQLWVRCMNNDPDAWKKMETYNIGDVKLLEKVYNAVLPWIPNHPNIHLYNGTSGCPKCGSTKIQSRGKQVNKLKVYKRYLCTGCGSWLQGACIPMDRAKREMFLTQAR